MEKMGRIYLIKSSKIMIKLTVVVKAVVHSLGNQSFWPQLLHVGVYFVSSVPNHLCLWLFLYTVEKALLSTNYMIN